MKHIWVSGLKLSQIEEHHNNLVGLNWVGDIPSTYSFHIFQNKNNTGGIASCSDAFGGAVSWARYEGENKVIGKEIPHLDSQEIDFLKRKYPAFIEAINKLDD